ncbi:MAG: DUF2505 domain-containing protein [Nocardioides sp.]
MRLRHELSYEATPAEVFAMLADPAFREKVCAAQDVVSAAIDLTPTDTGFTLVNDQVQNTAGLPAIAKKIAGDTTRAVTTENWTSATKGTLSISAPGKPTSASGTITLTAAGASTTQVIELEVKVKVPLIAGKLEALMGDQITAGYDVEQAVARAWLAGDR